ncbi:hypothetical protein ACA910_019863 [Epithemia clementina (nom. ined.)]
MHPRVVFQSNHDYNGRLELHEFLFSNVSLSFWGGIDPNTGIVIDLNHPWHGQSVANKIICLPSGRGSCTASQVLLELILNGKAPRAILLRDLDGLLTVGALVADEICSRSLCPDILWLEGDQKVFLALQKLVEDSASNDNNNAVPGSSAVCVAWMDMPPSHVALLNVGSAKAVDDYLENLPDDYYHDDLDFESRRTEPNYTPEEERMFNNCKTDAEVMALKVIFRYARIMYMKDGILESEISYRSIKGAHIDGCTYIGLGGLQFAQRLVQAGGRVKVPTTLNAVSADRRQWQKLGVPEMYARNSITLGDCYLELGCQPSFTCAPYLLNNNKNSPPKLGEHICWGESNAVVFANSVLGARTTKYADYLDICCAIAGIVPETCVHLDINRVPEIALDARELVQQVNAKMLTSHSYPSYDSSWDALFPILGHLCGTLSDGKVPILIGLEQWSGNITRDHLKAFCAAFGTTGTSPLIHIAGITPEACDSNIRKEWGYTSTTWWKENVIPVTLAGLSETFDRLDKDRETNPRVELIALGNPHLSVTECQQMLQFIQLRNNALGQNGNVTEEQEQSVDAYKFGSRSTSTTKEVKKNDNVRIMACMSRELYDLAKKKGFIAPLEEFGVEFVHDTCWCMLLDPPVIPTTHNTATLTNSGKYAHYGPGLTNRPFRFACTADCIEAAVTGQYPSRRPTWLLPPLPSPPLSPPPSSLSSQSPTGTMRTYCTSTAAAAMALTSTRPRTCVSPSIGFPGSSVYSRRLGMLQSRFGRRSSQLPRAFISLLLRKWR